MKPTALLLPASIPVLALALASASGCARAEARPPLATVSPREAVELVVYSGDFAMVREIRRVDLAPGRSRIGLQEISRSLDQNSVLFRWPKRDDARVLSSTYDLGTSDSGHLLRRFLGRTVDLVYRGDNGREGDRVSGTLEVADPGNVVVKADGKYIVNPNATIEAPADAGIVTIPQLSAEVESRTGGAADLGVAYMTEGLSWSADYTATLAPEGDRLGLECWATVTNRTGTDYPDAKITFVAGSPNRAVRDRSPADFVSGRAAAKAEMREDQPMAGAAAPQAMGELYAYPYESTATVRQDEMNRVRMMDGRNVAVKRVYSIALPSLSREYAALDPNDRLGATLGINFVNAKAAGLGRPLPGGAIRVYEPDASGGVRYVGAATIGDTPKDARVSLELTNVFDVYAYARQVSAQIVDKRHTRRTVEVVLHNEKAKPVEARLVQPLEGPWRPVAETTKGVRGSASSHEWTVSVPAGGEARLRATFVFGP